MPEKAKDELVKSWLHRPFASTSADKYPDHQKKAMADETKKRREEEQEQRREIMRRTNETDSPRKDLF